MVSENMKKGSHFISDMIVCQKIDLDLKSSIVIKKVIVEKRFNEFLWNLVVGSDAGIVEVESIYDALNGRMSNH